MAALQVLNAARLGGEPAAVEPGRALERELRGAARRLAVYGTLAPGRENHHLMERFPGRWTTGTVRGTLYPAGWGAVMGAPGMTWQPDGEPIAVHLLESAALRAGWTLLDRFEGPEYARLLVPVETAEGVRVANIYALRAETLRLD